jgi:hypothetical protein
MALVLGDLKAAATERLTTVAGVRATAFLASDRASGVTATVVNLTGGEVAD